MIMLCSSGNLVAGMTPLGSSGKMCAWAFERCLLWISCTQSLLMWWSFEFLVPQVKVSFHTTLELLTYQHLPDTQLLPGFQVLQFENGERKLKFNQNLVIEHSNCTTQVRSGGDLWALRKGRVLSTPLTGNECALGFTRLWNTAPSRVNCVTQFKWTATQLQKEMALCWACGRLLDGQSGFGSAPWCSYPSSVPSVTARVRRNPRAANPVRGGLSTSFWDAGSGLSQRTRQWLSHQALPPAVPECFLKVSWVCLTHVVWSQPTRV